MSRATSGASITARRVGREGQAVAIVDGFHPDPDALRAYAIAAAFGPARNHYPGVRADLPPDYFRRVGAPLATVLRDVLGGSGGAALIDASFSVVTTPPADLTPPQRLPHVDALEPDRVALVHYLSPEGGDGTAFFRHRSTGFETINAARGRAYTDRLRRDLGGADPPPGYMTDGPLFERIGAADARYNRAVIYRSQLLHSGAIAPDAVLSADPATGRLTVTAFLRAEPRAA